MYMFIFLLHENPFHTGKPCEIHSYSETLTDPLKDPSLTKDEAVQKVEFMDAYSISQEDYDSIMELSQFKKHPNPLEGINVVVKAALTKAYKQGSSSRVIRSADLITLPGFKKASKETYCIDAGAS